MFSSNKPKPSPEQMVRATQRDLNKNKRNLEREVQNLRMAETQLIAGIKAEAKKGNEASAKQKARELVGLRGQISKLEGMQQKMNGVQAQTVSMQAQHTIAKALSSATSALSVQNSLVNPEQLQRTMMEFERQNQMLEIKDDLLDDLFENDLEDEDEADSILSQVADEIGLDLSSLLSVPSHPLPASSSSSSF